MSSGFSNQSLVCFMQLPLVLHPAAFYRSLTSSLVTHETCRRTCAHTQPLESLEDQIITRYFSILEVTWILLFVEILKTWH